MLRLRCSLSVAAVLFGGCGDAPVTEPSAGVLRLSGTGELTRPPVHFRHEQHTKALGPASCKECHLQGAKGEWSWTFLSARAAPDADEAMHRFHDGCIGCHERATPPSGPVVCAGCHPATPRLIGAQAEMRFDNSLHARHVKAHPDKCDTCHHVRDQASGALVAAPGQESGCLACHGPVARDGVRSLRQASHDSCVSCHLQAKSEPRPPFTCTGCHDAAAQAAFTRLPDPPRLMRGQPDHLWVSGGKASETAVPFAHAAHERIARACSDCHHLTMDRCSSCHTQAGAEKGGGIILAEAHHRRDATASCVGCHAQQTEVKACSGCHDPSAAAGPEKTSCVVCHRGATDAAALTSPPPAPSPVELAPLATLVYEAEIVIDSGGGEYQAAKLPHGKIITALDRPVRDSALARAFHQQTDTLCAGCHHHAPVGTRPAPCVSCHGVAGVTDDRPGLKVAYHRQCIGCHERMGLPVGCTDCHAAIGGAEVRP